MMPEDEEFLKEYNKTLSNRWSGELGDIQEKLIEIL